MEKIGEFVYEPAKFDEITSDTLLLAGFIPTLSDTDALLDIGTGSGALPLMLAGRDKNTHITGVEIQEPRAEAARRAVVLNGLSSRVSIVHGDYRTLSGVFPKGAFTHIVSNPPYVRAGCGRGSPVIGRQAARSEVFGAIGDLVRVAEYLMGESGGLFLVFTAARFAELLQKLNENALSPVRLRFVHPKEGAPASRFLVEAVKDPQGKRALVVEGPIILRQGVGEPGGERADVS